MIYIYIIHLYSQVITNEIGEGVNFHDLLNANSNWRGRAQQILGLQKKVCLADLDIHMYSPSRDCG